MIDNLLGLILEIAEQNPEGFTHSLRGIEPTSGFIIAYAATQDSFGIEGLQKCITHAMIHEGLVGGWYDEKTKLYYFDSCKVMEDLDEAIDYGREQNQKSIWYINKLVEIKLK